MFFTFLSLSLSSVPYVFTKVVKPLEKYRRIQGLCIAIFVDDGCHIKARAVRADLCNTGFVVNGDESVCEPTRALNWLGIT